jgi:hypothetical protein
VAIGKGGPSETHVPKITNVPVFYMALRPNDFDADKSITQAIGVFWAQMTLAAFARCPFRAKKSFNFREHPFQWPS